MIYTVGHKKRGSKLLSITLANLNPTDILSPFGVDWNSALWMTPLISGDIVC